MKLREFAFVFKNSDVSIYPKRLSHGSKISKFEFSSSKKWRSTSHPHQKSPSQQSRVPGPTRWLVYFATPPLPMFWWCWGVALVCNLMAVWRTVRQSPCWSANHLHVREGRGDWWYTGPHLWKSTKEKHNNVVLNQARICLFTTNSRQDKKLNKTMNLKRLKQWIKKVNLYCCWTMGGFFQ